MILENRIRKEIACLFIFCFSILDGFGQLKISPVSDPSQVYGENGLFNKKIAEDTITLPVWDDFSGGTGIPDPDIWMPGSGVFVNNTLAANPPTLGVATFDGATQDGGIYDSDPFAVGKADSLVSKPINLGTLNAEERNSVYLSFFWQYFGIAEMPDQEDSLRLLFLNQQDRWEVIDTFTKNRVSATDSFTQVIYKIDNRFLHGSFQFKFEVFARLSGPYDTWHIDYIYLDKNRNLNDNSYFDRAIATLPDYIFKDFSAIPLNQFFANPQKFINNSFVDIYNLDDFLQPIEYTAKLVNTFDRDQTYQLLNVNTEVNPILQGKHRRRLYTEPLNPGTLDDKQDSIYMTLEFYISSGDSILDNGINYRVNDSASFDFVLHNYFATDDGTAENGLGLEQKGGMVAYRFVLEVPDVLNGVDLHFPNIGRIQAGSGFSLFVWKKLSGLPEDVIYERENLSIDPIEQFNEFQSIRLPDLFVSDTFYIGWEQYTSDFFALGFDKSHDHGENIFYNISGEWEQNNEFKGSLMLRPNFGDSLPTSLPLARRKEAIKVYPNPTSDFFKVEGTFEKLIIRDLTGKIIHERKYDHAARQYGVPYLTHGIYIITFIRKEDIQIQKLIIKN